jgi:hypothetical protein
MFCMYLKDICKISTKKKTAERYVDISFLGYVSFMSQDSGTTVIHRE